MPDTGTDPSSSPSAGFPFTFDALVVTTEGTALTTRQHNLTDASLLSRAFHVAVRAPEPQFVAAVVGRWPVLSQLEKGMKEAEKGMKEANIFGDNAREIVAVLGAALASQSHATAAIALDPSLREELTGLCDRAGKPVLKILDSREWSRSLSALVVRTRWRLWLRTHRTR